MEPKAIGVLLVLTLSVPAGATPSEYVDQPFVQDYSEKIPRAPQVGAAKLLKVRMDRNGRIGVLSDKGLLQVEAGLLRPDRQSRPLVDTVVKDIEVHQGEFLYRTADQVLSNTGAGRLLTKDQMPAAPEPVTDLRGQKLPCREIRCTGTIGDSTWFGTPRGAFALHPDGRLDYYASQRWLLDDAIVDIWPGPDHAILILSATGLNIIHFREMTLAGKAKHFDRLTRQRHIRYGFSSSLALSVPGDLSSGTLIDADGKPTQWGRWHPEYVNRFPRQVGDRRLNSIEIIAFQLDGGDGGREEFSGDIYLLPSWMGRYLRLIR